MLMRDLLRAQPPTNPDQDPGLPPLAVFGNLLGKRLGRDVRAALPVDFVASEDYVSA